MENITCERFYTLLTVVVLSLVHGDAFAKGGRSSSRRSSCVDQGLFRCIAAPETTLDCGATAFARTPRGLFCGSNPYRNARVTNPGTTVHDDRSPAPVMSSVINEETRPIRASFIRGNSCGRCGHALCAPPVLARRPSIGYCGSL